MDAQEAVARENYDWFQDHLSEMEKQYEDKYLVIKDKAVLGAYSSYRDAFESVKGKEKPGTYIIQLCSSDEEKTLNVFHSRVSFN